MRVSYDLKKQLKKANYLPSKGYIAFFVIICVVIFILIIGSCLIKKEEMKSEEFSNESNEILKNNNSIVEDYFNKRQIYSNLSKLGEIILLNKSYPQGRSKLFHILIWQEGLFLERRHINYFTKEKHDPFETCSVNNCDITYESDDLAKADAVVYYLQKFKSPEDLPQRTSELFAQRWIFLSDQSPFNTFQYRENDWRNYSNIFNWSMTYRMESDIPIPYGRTLPSIRNKSFSNIENLIPHITKKQRQILISTKPGDCIPNKKRMIYVTELQKYLNVDVYGKCATNPEDSCLQMTEASCPRLDKYLFYLSFENSNCDQFMTENLFWAAYSKGAIPIIMGPTKENCEILLPPNSFIHVENFAEPSDLAVYIAHLNTTWDENFFKYHEWRKDFAAIEEHGYYGTPSKYYCRICEALNYNDEASKIYANLSQFLSVEGNCRN